MTKKNQPLDREYFKRRANPTIKKGPQLTKCCGQDKDYDSLNVRNSEDWKLIENYIEEHLREYTKHISVTPVSCEKCGILLEYYTDIDIDKTLGYYEKSN
jgi:hypothetical protein